MDEKEQTLVGAGALAVLPEAKAESLVTEIAANQAISIKPGEIGDFTIVAPQLLPGRANFANLLYTNPNYFGTMPELGFEAILPMVGNTFYEELHCIGLQPEANRLEGIVDIKRHSGYETGACSVGSREYVRFYVLRSDDTWHDLGLANFTTYNLATSQLPITYSVAVDMNEARKFCSTPNVLRVRGILSWNVEPPANQPDWSPIWGNRLEVNVQIATRPFFDVMLSDYLKEKLITLDDEILHNIKLEQKLEFHQPKELAYGELKQLYAKQDVPPHRFGFKEAQALAAKPIQASLLPDFSSLVKLSDTTLPDMAKAANGNGNAMAEMPLTTAANISVATASSLIAFPQKLGKDLADIFKGMELLKGNTTYEELECVGYNPATRTLAGVIGLKRSNGFSGSLCSVGSTEHVGFWAFYSGSWHALGGTTVTVHDLPGISPDNRVQYAAFRTVALPELPCNSLHSIQVRAILSWNTPPTGPDFNPPWGNVVDTFIQPRLGDAFEPGVHTLRLNRIGRMNVDTINNTTGRATSSGIAGNFICSDSPFGGMLYIDGDFTNSHDIDVFNPSTGQVLPGTHPLRYQIWVNKVGEAPTQLLNSFTIGVTTASDLDRNVPQATVDEGTQHFYNYLEGGTQVMKERILGVWYAGGLTEGLYHVEVKGFVWSFDPITSSFHYQEVSTQGRNVYIYNGYPHTENLLGGGSVARQAPKLDLRITYKGDTLPTVVMLESGAMAASAPEGVLECTDVTVNQFVGGTYSITDNFPGSFETYLPNISIGGEIQISPIVAINGPAGTTTGPVPAAPGVATSVQTGTWYFATAEMHPCGYSIILSASDRALVDSSGNHHYNSRTVGFCLRAAQG